MAEPMPRAVEQLLIERLNPTPVDRPSVAAGRAGGFGYVVGVDRTNQADALRHAGADVTVSDLSDLLKI